MEFDEVVFITSEGLLGFLDIFRCTNRRKPLAEYYRARIILSFDLGYCELSRDQNEYTDKETNNYDFRR